MRKRNNTESPGGEEKPADRMKREAGYYAADMVGDGMVVGLGTGSTVGYTMERLSDRIREGLRIQGVPTSFQAEIRAREFHKIGRAHV